MILMMEKSFSLLFYNFPILIFPDGRLSGFPKFFSKFVNFKIEMEIHFKNSQVRNRGKIENSFIN